MRSCPAVAGTRVSPSPAGWQERRACIVCPLCSSEAPHGSPWAQIQLCAGRVPGGLDSFPGLLQLLEPLSLGLWSFLPGLQSWLSTVVSPARCSLSCCSLARGRTHSALDARRQDRAQGRLTTSIQVRR